MAILRKLQQRRGTAAALAYENEIIPAGQLIFVTDQNRLKVGTGDTYNNTSFLSVELGDIANSGASTGQSPVWNGTSWESVNLASASDYLPLAGGTMTGQIALDSSTLKTATNPALTFDGANTTTGIYSPGTNIIAASTNGVERLRINDVGDVYVPRKIGIGKEPAGGNQEEKLVVAADGTLASGDTFPALTMYETGNNGNNSLGVQAIFANGGLNTPYQGRWRVERQQSSAIFHHVFEVCFGTAVENVAEGLRVASTGPRAPKGSAASPGYSFNDTASSAQGFGFYCDSTNINANLQHVGVSVDGVGVAQFHPNSLRLFEPNSLNVQRVSFYDSSATPLIKGDIIRYGSNYSQNKFLDAAAGSLAVGITDGDLALGTGTEHGVRFGTANLLRGSIDKFGQWAIETPALGTSSGLVSLIVKASASANVIRCEGRSSDNICQILFSSNTGVLYSKIYSESNGISIYIPSTTGSTGNFRTSTGQPIVRFRQDQGIGVGGLGDEKHAISVVRTEENTAGVGVALDYAIDGTQVGSSGITFGFLDQCLIADASNFATRTGFLANGIDFPANPQNGTGVNEYVGFKAGYVNSLVPTAKGFLSDIDTIANITRHNFYAEGTADNFFRGRVGIGPGADTPESTLYVTSLSYGGSDRTEIRIQSLSSGTSWSTTDSWGRLGFGTNDTSANAGGTHFAIDATAETVGGGTAYASLKFWDGVSLDEHFRFERSGNFTVKDTSGNDRLILSSTGLKLVNGQILVGNGASGTNYSTPSIGGTTSADAGVNIGTDIVSLVTDGLERLRVSSAGTIGLGGDPEAAVALNLLYEWGTSTSTSQQCYVAEPKYGVNATSVQAFRADSTVTSANCTVYNYNVAPGKEEGSGTIQTQVGLHVNDLTLGTARAAQLRVNSRLKADNTPAAYNVFADGSAPNYFNGKVGIGTTDPTYKFEVVDGSTKSGFSGSVCYVEHTGNADSGYAIRRADANKWTIANDYSAGDDFVIYQGGFSGTERLRLDSFGKVGIGDTPTYFFDVASPNNTVARFRRTTPAGQCTVRWENGGGNYFDLATVSDYFAITDTVSERLRLDGNGNVGIGTTTPGALLDVNGDAKITGDLTVTGNITGTISSAGDQTVGGNLSVSGDLFVGGSQLSPSATPTDYKPVKFIRAQLQPGYYSMSGQAVNSGTINSIRTVTLTAVTDYLGSLWPDFVGQQFTVTDGNGLQWTLEYDTRTALNQHRFKAYATPGASFATVNNLTINFNATNPFLLRSDRGLPATYSFNTTSNRLTVTFSGGVVFSPQRLQVQISGQWRVDDAAKPAINFNTTNYIMPKWINCPVTDAGQTTNLGSLVFHIPSFGPTDGQTQPMQFVQILMLYDYS